MSTFPPPPPTTPPPGGPQKTSRLAIGALVGAFLCFPVGLILGIVALTRIGKAPTLKGKGLAITGIVLSGVFMLCLPLPAIAIPNYLRFQARAKQSECKANLRAAYTAQRMLFTEEERYSESAREIGLVPENSRYAYFFGPEIQTEGDEANALPPTRPENLNLDTAMRAITRAGVRPGVTGECPEGCEVVMACAGDLDGDLVLDVWSVSSEDRQLEGEYVPAGQPHNHVSDVTE